MGKLIQITINVPVHIGASKVLFSNQIGVAKVNKATGKSVFQNVADHKNHIHMDCRFP